MKTNNKIAFLIIGGGAQFNKIKNSVKQMNLTNVLFKPYQPREKLHLSLTASDIHVISLIPELEGLIVPSKFYGIAASGKPVLYIGSQKGEIPGILEETGCGEAFRVDQVNEIVKYIDELSNDIDRLDKMGMSAWNVFNSRFEKRKAFESWIMLLKKIAM